MGKLTDGCTSSDKFFLRVRLIICRSERHVAKLKTAAAKLYYYLVNKAENPYCQSAKGGGRRRGDRECVLVQLEATVLIILFALYYRSKLSRWQEEKMSNQFFFIYFRSRKKCRINHKNYNFTYLFQKKTQISF